MSTNDKGRDRWHGATPKTPGRRNHNATDPLVGWFNLARSSRIHRQQKRGWQGGRQ
jgi:hypothetical protein